MVDEWSSAGSESQSLWSYEGFRLTTADGRTVAIPAGYQRPHGARHRLWLSRDQRLGRDECRKRVMLCCRWPLAPAGVEHDGPDAPAHRDLGPHAVRPEPIQGAGLQRFGSGHTKRHAGLSGAWHRPDPDAVSLEIQAGEVPLGTTEPFHP